MFSEKKHIRFRIGLYQLILFLVMGTYSSTLFAQQQTVAVGQILSKTDRKPIASANVSFKNSSRTVQSDAEGYFVIKTTDNVHTLVFSCVGYKQMQIRLQPGQSIGMEVLMEEENTLLQEVFVLPGVNPALDLMQRVRRNARRNDITRSVAYRARSTEQNVVLLNKLNQRFVSKRIFDQLRKGSLTSDDSSLVTPLYIAQKQYELTANEKREINANLYSSPSEVASLLESFVAGASSDLNFYNPSISVFGKNIISPLSPVGNAYYAYSLWDSTGCGSSKQYELHFKSRNTKNLALSGKFSIDSTTLALLSIDATLPPQANINFIHNLHVKTRYALMGNGQRVRDMEELTMNLDYEFRNDTVRNTPEIFMKRTARYEYADSVLNRTDNRSQDDYSLQSLDEKLAAMADTPLMQTARWIADVAFTGNMKFGKIDVGNILQLARLTDVEGLRLNLPWQTNEQLWKNISLGGSMGYGMRNRSFSYSAKAQVKIPGTRKRVASLSYISDFRRVDYNYNDFVMQERVLANADENISTTLLALKSGSKINPRTELCFSFTNDWNSNVESTLLLRSNNLYSNSALPFVQNAQPIESLHYSSATVYTRFSNNERTYEDHLRRIYIANNKPVLSFLVEGGRYQVGTEAGNFARLAATIRHIFPFDFGRISYVAEAGCVLGNVPYPLLHIPTGTEARSVELIRTSAPVQTGSGGYNRLQFNMMKYMEFGTDRYVDMVSELTLNGLILNQIPLLKQLNLREMFSFKMTYGSLDESHSKVMELPGFLRSMNKPYMEAGVGITNIMRVFSIQSVWRLTDTNQPGVYPWGLRLGLSISF